MEEMSAQEHLKIARRLHFQGASEEAIRQYEAALALDPDNADAISGLRALGVEPTLRDDISSDEVGHAGGLKTSFLSNQAKGSTSGGVKAQVFQYIVIALGIGMCYGLYVLAQYLINYENVEAMDSVDVSFEKPKLKDGIAVVNVDVVNTNPGAIRHLKIGYRITDATDQTLKEGKVELPGQVPPGDRRTFQDVSLGEIKGHPAKLTPKLEAIIYGPKPKLKQRYIDKFKEAAAVPDKQALQVYKDLVQDTEEFAPAYVGLGRAYAAKGKWSEALQSYKAALDIDPQNANAHYYSAVVLYYMKKLDEAKKEIDQALLIAPDDPDISWTQKTLFMMKDKPGDKKGGDAKSGNAKSGDAKSGEGKSDSGEAKDGKK